MDIPHNAPSNNSFLGLPMDGAGVTKAGLRNSSDHLNSSEDHVKDLHGCTRHGRRVAHDDTFRDSCNTDAFPVRSGVKEVIRCLLEGRQHEYAVLHLCYTEPRDTEDFALSNNFGIQVTWISPTKRI